MGDYGSVYRHVFPDTLSRRQINQKTASASCLQIKQEASVISAMRERSLFHDIICNGNSASEHRLLFDYPVSTTKEKRFCRKRSIFQIGINIDFFRLVFCKGNTLPDHFALKRRKQVLKRTPLRRGFLAPCFEIIVQFLKRHVSSTLPKNHLLYTLLRFLHQSYTLWKRRLDANHFRCTKRLQYTSFRPDFQ